MMRDRDAALMFLGYYSQLDAATLEQLASSGRKVARCDCGQDGCRGWQMAWPDDEVEGFPVVVLNGR